MGVLHDERHGGLIVTNYLCAEGSTHDTYNVTVQVGQVISDNFYCDGECHHTASWSTTPTGITVSEDSDNISHIDGIFTTAGTYTVTFHCDECGDTHIVYTVQSTASSEWLPKAQVRIFKNLYAYADVTFDMVTQPTIYKAVNRPGSFKFVLNNDPNDSYLADTFDGWNDGSTGAIDWGMYCIIENITESGTAEYVTDGIITTLELNEYTLSVECADHLALLGSSGADIHRNYYDTRTANDSRDVIVGQASDNYIESNVTSIYEQSGQIETSTVKYRVEDPDTSMDSESAMYFLSDGSRTYVVSWTGSIAEPFKGISFKLNKNLAGNMTCTMRIAGITKTVTITGNNGDQAVYVDFGTLLEAGTYTIEFEGTPDYSGVPTQLRIYVNVTSGHGTVYSSYAGTTVYGHLRMNIAAFFERAVTSCSVITRGSDTYLRISGITTVTSITDSYAMLTYPHNNRVLLTYTTGTVSASTIITNICNRVNYVPTINTGGLADGEPTFTLFRTGGGYALDYLQKVADTGNSMTFTAKGMLQEGNHRGPNFYAGARRTSASPASYNVVYGNTTQTISDLIMFQFKPTKSMKNRPSRVMIRTAISDKGDTESEPVLAMVYNLGLVESRHNVKTDKAISSSSVLSVYDAVRSAYDESYADEEDWGGTLTLSGIIPDMIDADGQYAGSGKVLSITDPRYGFEDKAFVITDVTIDYETITTKVTLSNEAQIYGSAVSDAIAMAYTTSDLVVGDTNSTLYNTQYVYVKVTGPTVYTAGNAITLHTLSKNITIPNVTAYVMEGHTLLYGAVKITSSDASTAKYDGKSLTVNGTRFNIPTDAQPDCYEDQYVIINVDVTT